MRKSSLWLRFAYWLGCSIFVLAATWYYQRSETPPWKQEHKNPPHFTDSTEKGKRPHYTESATSAFRFVSYNLKNWLSSSQNPEKSKDSKKAIVNVLTSSNADIIGLSEIGSETDVREIQKLLKIAGKDLPFFHHTGGTDPIRHLAIISRFPIISTKQPEITIAGTDHSMQRGILDTTIQVKGQTVRFIGIHLKSKRIVPNYDQAQLRVLEAEHVRKHIDSIFSTHADSSLIVYGDFNDHIQSLSTKTILGNYRSPFYLTPVHIADQRGEKWTYYFQSQDSYSRIDFITVSKNLKPHIDKSVTGIIDISGWDKASDHRAIRVGFN